MQEYPEYFHFSFSQLRPSQKQAVFSNPKNRELASQWAFGEEPKNTGRFTAQRNTSAMPGFLPFDWATKESYDKHWGTRTAQKNWATATTRVSPGASRPMTSATRSAPATPQNRQLSPIDRSATLKPYARTITPTKFITGAHCPMRRMVSRSQTRQMVRERPVTADATMTTRSVVGMRDQRGGRSPASTTQVAAKDQWAPTRPQYGRNRCRVYEPKERTIYSRDIMNATLPKNHMSMSMFGPPKPAVSAGKPVYFPMIDEQDSTEPVQEELEPEDKYANDPTHCKYCAWDGCRGCELRIGSGGFGTQPTHFVY